MEKLFEPGLIGKLTIPNRIAMAPMGAIGLTELDGRFSERGVDFYAARAKGGVGLIITSACLVDVEVEPKLSKGFSGMPRIDSPTFIARLNELALAVHQYGAKVCVQLHVGNGRVISTGLYPVTEPVAPSPQPWFWNKNVMCRALTVGEIKKIVDEFGIGAEIAREAGIDCVEVLGHEGYLLDQFMTALWNRRTDEYGGDLDGRLRIHLEIIESIRKRVGKDYPVIFQYGARHHIEGGRDIPGSREIARRLEKVGVDALQIDAGCYDAWYWPHPPIYQSEGCMVEEAEAIKKVVNVPVIAVGKLGNPELAEKVLSEGKADFVALGRPLLADPDWANKVREGRLDDILMCIGDQEGCLSRIFSHKHLSCTVNPACGMERRLALTPAVKRKHVLVIGGGPGGMEAARVAALRGHQVTLWEKKSDLGGNLVPASVPEFKKDIRYLIKYLPTQLKKLGVNVCLSKEATLEQVKTTKPDAVIIATGSTHVIPDIPGINKKIMVTAIDVLLGKKETAQHVAVIGGGVVGCETAIYLSRLGKDVTLIEAMPEINPDINFANKSQLLQMLKDSSVTTLVGACLLEVLDKRIAIGKNGNQQIYRADTVVLAVGFKPEEALYQQLENEVSEVYSIGDCVRPRKILDAMWEGFYTSSRI